MNREDSFTDEDARRAWNRGATGWLNFVRSGADYYRLLVHGPALLELCSPVAGVRALDLGCGEGYFSRELARAGARVVGIDLSEQLIDAARLAERDAPLRIEYHPLSATDAPDVFGPATFDLVTACMSLQDMSDTEGALRAAAAVLRPGGRFVFSVPHPATDTPLRTWKRDAEGAKQALMIGGYFDAGPAVCEWNMPRLIEHWATPHWRRTLEEWSVMIEDAGLAIRRLREPRPSAEALASEPRLLDCSMVPYFLLMELGAG